MLHRLLAILFPPKCILCRRVLKDNETDLCHACRKDTPEFIHPKRNIPFVAQWTGIWYYSDNVRGSIHRYKFSNARRYAAAYAKLLAVRLQKEEMDSFDILSWIPVSASRKRKRGYDQSQLLAEALGQELGCEAVAVLKKYRNNPPQSTLTLQAERRANVLGAYRLRCPETAVAGKRVLVADDILTTGSTLSECARMLKTAGASRVLCVCAAAARKS